MPSMTTSFTSGHRRLGGRRGQSLIVAVIVLFVLLFVGGIFVALVGRNLLNTGRARETVSALQFAEAGVRYADHFLQYSTEGADWRPEPTVMTNPNDPDKLWLQDTVNPWTRVDLGNGRALIRVSYLPGYVPDPANPGRLILNPVGKYIRIESVGRTGFLNDRDPTTFLNTPAPRLNRKLIAYKAVGLTDYLRFVTNRYNDSKFTADIGVPPLGVRLAMQLGAMPLRVTGAAGNPNFVLPGAPIRINGNARLMGDLVLGLDRRNADAVLVSGAISANPTIPPVVLDPETGTRYNILSSDSGAFTTIAGRVRDGSPDPDANGYARGIPALAAPLIDAPDPATGVTRYRALSRNSGRWINDPRGGGRTFNTGVVGLGAAGLYINNRGSREPDPTREVGADSLRSIWLQPGSNRYWQGPFYIPPGAFIDFGYQLVTDPATGAAVQRPGFRVMRDDNRAFVDPNDPTFRTRKASMQFTFFVYAGGTRPVIKLDNAEFRNYLKSVFSMSDAAVDAWLPEFNGVVFAEGNIRVRGLLPAKASLPVRGGSANLVDVNPPSVTVVSDATIYVEGSVVSESPDTKIALLAADNVAVNATVLVGPTFGSGYSPSNQDQGPPYHVSLTSGSQPLIFDFMFGDDPAGYTPFGGAGSVPIQLLIRHGVEGTGNAYANLLVNESLVTGTGTDDALYRFNTNAAPYTTANPPPWVRVLTNSDENKETAFEKWVFPMLPRVNGATYPFNTTPGFVNILQPRPEPNYTLISGDPPLPYLVDHAAVVPMDVRIEAVMYAQNGSFFIIPGPPFNADPADTRDAALEAARNLPGGPYAADAMKRPDGTHDAFPFYGEPIDCRITIVGSVSENRTASVSDQAAWMRLWGYIPVSYGSTGHDPAGATTTEYIPDQHVRVYDVGGTVPGTDPRTVGEQADGITRGLRFFYDPALALPYAGYNSVGGAPFRRDDIGRVLPPLPRLPVCPGFVYYGPER